MKKKSISNNNNDNGDKYNDTNDDDQLTYPETSNVMQNWCKYCHRVSTRFEGRLKTRRPAETGQMTSGPSCIKG